MGSLFNRIRKNARVEMLEAGIHENIFVEAIDINQRDNNGIPSKRDCFIKFSKYDAKTDKVIGGFEGSWFKFDFTSEYNTDRVLEKIAQLVKLMEYYVTSEEIDEKFTIFEEAGIKSVDDFKSKMKEKEVVEALEGIINDKLFEIMAPFVGTYSKDTKMLRLKLTTDKNGKFTQLPAFGNFVESMEEDQNMTYVPVKVKEIVDTSDM